MNNQEYYAQMKEYEKMILRWMEDIDRASAEGSLKASNPIFAVTRRR